MSKRLDEYDFPVDIVPLNAAAPDGTQVPIGVDVGRAVMRLDNNDVLAINGPRYRLTPYAEVVDHFTSQLQNVLGARSNVDTIVTLEKGGAQMRYQVILNDLVLEPDVGDIVRISLDLWDSYDMSWARQSTVKGHRLWCRNGCTSPDWQVDGYAKHTGDGNLSRLSADRIGAAINGYLEYGKRFTDWAKIPVTELQASRMFQKTLAAPTEQQKKDKKAINEKLLADLMHRWEEPATLWTLYNAATAWATHFDTRRGANTSNITRDRLRKVSETIESPAWRELEVA